jgi:hypothetical protein
MCNSWNHPPGCTCGWGGDGHRGKGGYRGGGTTGGPVQTISSLAKPNVLSNAARSSTNPRRRYTNPNASCPVCDAPVYFFQSEFGARVFFDDLGYPWQKHPCTDNPIARKNTVLASNAWSEPKAGATKWRALEKLVLRHRNGILSIQGLATDIGEENFFYFFGACALDGDYKFEETVLIEAAPPQDGVWNAVLLHWAGGGKLSFTDVRLFLEARDSQDVAVWEQAIGGGEHAQNAVGWMLSFGRKRNNVTDNTRLPIPIARYWFKLSAEQNFWAGHHNLGVMLLDGLGGVPDASGAFLHLREAARSLEPASLRRYARCYREGVGCKPDPEAAAAIELFASFERVPEEAEEDEED